MIKIVARRKHMTISKVENLAWFYPVSLSLSMARGFKWNFVGLVKVGRGQLLREFEHQKEGNCDIDFLHVRHCQV